MFRVHEEFPEHEKCEELAELCTNRTQYLAALGLWLAMGCDSRLRLSDGLVSRRRLKEKHGAVAVKLAVLLARVDLWEVEGDGFRFHDWADVQETKEQVLGRRAKDRDRQRKRRDMGSQEVSQRDTTPGSHEVSATPTYPSVPTLPTQPEGDARAWAQVFRIYGEITGTEMQGDSNYHQKDCQSILRAAGGDLAVAERVMRAWIADKAQRGNGRPALKWLAQDWDQYANAKAPKREVIPPYLLPFKE